eukprot:3350122-Amphidinium_carterae.1
MHIFAAAHVRQFATTQLVIESFHCKGSNNIRRFHRGRRSSKASTAWQLALSAFASSAPGPRTVPLHHWYRKADGQPWASFKVHTFVVSMGRLPQSSQQSRCLCDCRFGPIRVGSGRKRLIFHTVKVLVQHRGTLGEQWTLGPPGSAQLHSNLRWHTMVIIE